MQKRKEQKDLLNTDKERTLALQIKKMMKKMSVPSEDSDDEEAKDKDLAMIIKTMKKL